MLGVLTRTVHNPTMRLNFLLVLIARLFFNRHTVTWPVWLSVRFWLYKECATRGAFLYQSRINGLVLLNSVILLLRHRQTSACAEYSCSCRQWHQPVRSWPDESTALRVTLIRRILAYHVQASSSSSPVSTRQSSPVPHWLLLVDIERCRTSAAPFCQSISADCATTTLPQHFRSSGVPCCRSDGLEQPSPSSPGPDSQRQQFQKGTEDTSLQVPGRRLTRVLLWGISFFSVRCSYVISHIFLMKHTTLMQIKYLIVMQP